MVFVKICGVTSVDDALLTARAGADAVGLNFVETSRRRIDTRAARAIVEAVGDRVEIVAVVADRGPAELARLRAETGVAWLQLHGAEAPSDVAALLPRAYKAVHVGEAADVERARGFGGERLLVDAKVAGALGGTGQTFDWSLVTALAAERRLLLAGGLTPANVAAAIERVRPWGVDVASGVEREPRRKDPALVEAFVRAVRGAGERSP